MYVYVCLWVINIGRRFREGWLDRTNQDTLHINIDVAAVKSECCGKIIIQ